MARRILAAALAATLLFAPYLPARAANPMGYELLTQQEAASLPRNRGALGMDIERAQQITDDGLVFDLIRVKEVRRGSAGAQAGFKAGDQIIAIDGKVFASLAVFGAYVSSIAPGGQVKVDYIPAGGGPQQAQQVVATVGAAGQAAASAPGMSTGTKVAIGVGAAALFGCYELGCFSHRAAATGSNGAAQRQAQQQGAPAPR